MSAAVMLDYLAALEQNNDKEWFHANKAQYQGAVRAWEALVGELADKLRELDGRIPVLPPSALTFKLQRDTRFSHDKSPYNPCFRAHISSGGKLPIPVGYYLQLRPGGRSFLGGGLFADVFQNATNMVRGAIAAQGDEWERILTEPCFAGRFTVGGAKLKKPPRGYDPEHPQIEYLKHKSWYLELTVPDERVLAADFCGYAAEAFALMKPFNDFLNWALRDFRMPQR